MDWNGAHFHLVLNHLPVMGTFFGLILIIAAMLLRSDLLTRTALVAFFVTAVLTLPTYLTGEGAEHTIVGLPGVDRELIENHQSAALIAAIFIGVLGLLAAYGFVKFHRAEKLPQWLSVSALVLALVGGGLMLRAANLGGEIRHTEIRSGFEPPARNKTGAKPD